MNLAFRTIVVATDFSEPSQLAVEYARVFAKRFGANLRVLNVVEIPTVLSAEVPLPDVQGMASQAVAEAERSLADALGHLSETNVIGQVLVGHAAESIVRYAADHDADLIVMGTHGRSGLPHFLMGSVAERVIRSAPCPVFTVRDAEALRCATRDSVPAKAS